MNIVIVESPNKIKKISSILGNSYKVLASYGHIRDLDKKSISIDLKTFDAKYKITNNKALKQLQSSCLGASTIYLATDPDREGDGIAWHLQEILNVKYPKARRMTFNEITKSAILKALEIANKDGKININSVNSYKTRRFIDRIAGFKISPVLWKNITGAKSAGRVQSVASRIIIEKEIEIAKHRPEINYKFSGLFNNNIESTLNKTIKIKDDSDTLLKKCKEAKFTVSNKSENIVYNNPPLPFKTSTYQQDAGIRYHMSPKESMSIAQKLYEKGKITYHRTDICRLSDYFKQKASEYIREKYGNEYLGENKIIGVKKGEQAAHEAIRPTNIELSFLPDKFDKKEKLVYRMIWVRSVASLMSAEKCMKYSINILLSNETNYYFIATHLKTLFLGYKILTKEEENKKNVSIININNGDVLKYEKIESKENITQPEKRYTESMLVKELEKKGIGRPSTYASIINTIQDRRYVEKKKGDTDKKEITISTLKGNTITNKKQIVDMTDKTTRLYPTELGIEVTNFLVKNIPYLMEYEFTSNLENDLDLICNGNKEYKKVLGLFTDELLSTIKKIPKQERKKINRIVGEYKNSNIEFYVGKYGPFLKHNGKSYSLDKKYKKTEDICLEDAIKILTQKKYIFEHEIEIDNKKGIVQGLKGPYGYYLKYLIDGKTINKRVDKEYRNDLEKFRLLKKSEIIKFM
jgi:DNA topoisomerase-1